MLTVPLKHVKSADHSYSNKHSGHSFRSCVQKKNYSTLESGLIRNEKSSYFKLNRKLMRNCYKLTIFKTRVNIHVFPPRKGSQ